MPLKWEAQKRAEVVKYSGFDAENPQVKTEISQILSRCPLPAAEATQLNAGAKGPADKFEQYSEERLEHKDRQPATRMSPAQFRQLVAPVGEKPEGSGPLRATLWVAGGLALVVLSGGGYVLWRGQRPS